MSEPTMRAISQDVVGGPEVLREVEVPRPVPGPAEVLVRVRAAGVNPTDWKHRAAARFLGEPPYTLGWDVSGVVEEVGLGVALLEPGDEVLGMLPYPGRAGGYAEYVVAAPRTFVRKPASMDHVHAAALPLAALTAWQALVDIGGLRQGHRALVHAAAGGVGHLAVQIARHRGAYVVGTASAVKHDFVRGLGAHELVDYRAVDFADVVSDVDVVLDPIGGDYGPRSLATMRRGGTIVTLAVGAVHPGLAGAAAEKEVHSAVMLVERDHASLAEIVRLCDDGVLRVEVTKVLPMGLAARAHELGETGRTTGKIVLTWD